MTKKGTEPEPSDNAEESQKGALAKLAFAREEQRVAPEGFFVQYANILSEDTRYHWDKICFYPVWYSPMDNSTG